jgi:enterobactin synthetase component D
LGLKASSYVAMTFEMDTVQDLAIKRGLTLPQQLNGACTKRCAEFLAGRLCASEAIANLTGTTIQVGVNQDRSPAWPSGVVGSITHAASYAASAVGLASQVVGIGLDAEDLVDADVWESVGELVVSAQESALPSGLSENVFHTLLFCSKESVYKCLHPRVHRPFGFRDIAITAIDPVVRRFAFRLLVDLGSSFRRGFAHCGTFVLEQGRMHTAVELVVSRHPDLPTSQEQRSN